VRITSQIIDRRSLETIQRNLAGLDEAQLRATTGLRIRSASDDPASYAGVLSADRRLSALEQYRRNISSAQARLSTEEAAVDQVGEVLARAKELAISQAAGNGSQQTRLIAKAEIDQLLQQSISLGNTPWGNGFLFGGDVDNRRPFDTLGAVDPNLPPVGGPNVEYAPGQTAPMNHDGVQVFIDTGVFASLQRLSDALGANSDAEIGASITDLTVSFDRVQDLLGETGARARQLEMAVSNVESLTLSLKTLRSDLSEADLEVAITQLVTRQNAYQAALMATSTLLHTTITDYLR
jgi:flagellar hook-associated protein 3 FlgL